MSSAETTAPQVQDAAPATPRWQQVLIRPETMTLILLIIGVFAGSLLSPFFLDVNYILKSFTIYSEVAMVALVLTMVIIAGEIDLSPAANMALSAAVFAWLQANGVPIPVAVAAGLLSGLAMGIVNAFFVIALQLPSIIVTIGTLTLYRGLAQGIAGDASIRVPEWFIGVDRIMIGALPGAGFEGVSLPVMLFLILAIVLGVVLSSTIFGRQIYQIGTNETAAKHAGIRSARIKVGLFLLIGVVAAFAGIMTASRLGSVRYDLALGQELQMVLMAMLGGTYIFGGRGTILGTFLAVWLLVIVSTGMIVANVLPAVQLVVLGSLLIVSIIATNFIYSRTQR